MAIDLNRFDQTNIIIAPVHKLKYTDRVTTVYNNRVCTWKQDIEDGWYKIEMSAEGGKILDKADAIDQEELFKKLDSIYGFVYRDKIIPMSFNTMKMKYGWFADTIKVNFITAQPWALINCVRWEDDKLYYWKMNMSNLIMSVLTKVKEAFDNEKDINNLKYVTPELRYLFILNCIQRKAIHDIQKLEELNISNDEKEEIKKDFANSLSGKLLHVFEDAGAHLIHYQIKANGSLQVDWSVDGERFNSILSPDTFSVKEAGYCMSDADHDHNARSMILLAKEYMKDDLIYKTRE